MKILVLTEYIPDPIDSGSKKRIWHSIVGLSSKHNVVLLTFADEKQDPKSIDRLRRFCKIYFCARSSLRWWHILLNVFSLTPLGVWRRRSSHMKQIIHQVVDAESIDVFLVEEIWMAQYVTDFPIHKVIDKHNLEFVRANRRLRTIGNRRAITGYFMYIFFKLISTRMKRYELITLTRFDESIVCSTVDETLIHRLLPSMRVSVVANGVDVDYFKLRDKEPKENILVFTGTFSYEPNEDAALFFAEQIFPIVKRHNPDVKLHLVGSDPPKMVQALASDMSIVVTGYVEDVRPYLYKAAIAIAPLRMGSGTRVKILEAMSSGVAVVATSIGVEGIDAEHNKELLIADDPDSFAEMIIRLLNAPENRKRLSKNSHYLIEQKYSWKKSQAKLLELFEEIEILSKSNLEARA